MAKILVAPGHGIRPDGSFDPGAIDPKSKVWEHDLNIKVAEVVVKKLHSLGHSVTYEESGATGRKAHDPNWVGTRKTLNTGLFDLGIEIHHDTYIAPNKGFGIISRGKYKSEMTRLCAHIETSYKDFGLVVRPSYPDVRGLGFLNAAKPALIWECGSTVGFSATIADQRGLAIANGIHNWTLKK